MRRLVLTFLLVPSLALAQMLGGSAPASTAASVPPAVPAAVPAPVASTISLRPADVEYPVELSSAGIQGTVWVRATLDPAGAVSNATLHESSRSSQLDETAVALVRRLTFKVRDASDGLLVPVEFLRDSIPTLVKKSCAEFNTDAAYFAATFPELEPARMKAVSLATGMLYMSLPLGSKDAKMAFAKSLKPAVPKLVAACAARPDALFLDTYRQAIRDSGG